jgi:glycosyltransferase involved in cell wall biosynthesis
MISKMYADIEVIILSFQYPYVEKSYRWFDATVYSFNGKNKGGISRLLLRKKVNDVLKRIHAEKKIVGLLSFWLNECAAIGKKIGDKFSIPHYCWILGQDAGNENKYPARLSVKSKELIALSDFLQDEFERNHSIRPFKVIPSGIEPTSFQEHERSIELLAVGSLIPLKRFEIFIEIVAELKKVLPEINAMIIGNGTEKPKLEKMILKFGLQNNIHLAGEFSHNEVLNKMQQSKILLHPSSYEGFSGVCQEALSRGAHVVSFCKAMNQNIEHWHIVNDKEEMKQKVFSLLQHSIDHTPVIPFSMSGTVQQLMCLYNANYTAQVSFFNERSSVTAL